MILRAHRWPTNAELLADVHKLGLIRDDDLVVDVTYGRGIWWNAYFPPRLVAHDLKVDGIDFRKLPEDDDSVDVIAFDPPYISPGGRKTSTIDSFNEGYGIDACPSSPADLHDMIADGIAEARRVLRPPKRKGGRTGGVLLMKCMNYVTSGKYLSAAYQLLDEAENLGFILVDEFVHLGDPGPQPKRKTQKHTRANYSNLFALRRAY